MANRYYERGHNSDGTEYMYETDVDGILIRKDKKILTAKEDSRTRSKKVTDT